MTEPTGQPGQLMSIGYVASMNIAQSIGKPELAPELEAAIKDEINAMSSHFTLAFADIQTTNEVALKKLKDEYASRRALLREEFNLVRAHPFDFAAAAVFFTGIGVLLGLFVH